MNNNYMVIDGKTIELSKETAREIRRQFCREVGPPDNIRLAETQHGIGVVIQVVDEEFPLKVMFSMSESGFMVSNYKESVELNPRDYKFVECTKREAEDESIALVLCNDEMENTNDVSNYRVCNKDDSHTWWSGWSVEIDSYDGDERFYKIVRR